MRSSFALLLSVACATALLACSEAGVCTVAGVTEGCACGNGSSGARVCSAALTWNACDCSGRIALANALPSDMSGDDGMSDDDMMSDPGGSNGGSNAGGGNGAMDASTSGMQGDAGAIDGGGAVVDGGGAPEAGVDAGPGDPTPEPPYRPCAVVADCDPGAQCLVTAGFPTTSSVCAPACTDASQCPRPEGSFEASVTCVAGTCLLNCTPVIFQPLLTCPAGMTCIAPLLGDATCQFEGM